MLILLIFAFLSGLVTIFAPCIWPLLPIILSSSATGGKRKPFGITLGIMTSFTLFTLTLSYLVQIIPFDPDILRLVAVIIIGFLGLTLVVPKLSQVLEGYVSRLSGRFSPAGQVQGTGLKAGFITGFSLGIVWTPCAGPILATIATLAATQTVNLQIVLVTIVYVIGVGIPLFIFATAGSALFTRSRVLSPYTGRIQQIFGLIMILTAAAIFTNYDKVLQVKLLDAFPSYSNFIVKLESSKGVKEQLDALKQGEMTGEIKRVEQPVEMNFPQAKKTLPILGKAPEFTGITKWLNTEKPLTMQELKGKVVLVDFWTYTCINCIRTLPHVTGWYEKYKDKGFIVIGVHTPEFEFEKKTDNVLKAMRQYMINYPVPQDNDFATWKAYNNRYWPAKYLVDAQGNIRYTHFGEGEYEETEKNIQDLLKEAGTQVEGTIQNMLDETPRQRQSPETYLGSDRMELLYPDGRVGSGKKAFTLSKNVPVNTFSFGGGWTIGEEYAMAGDNAVLWY